MSGFTYSRSNTVLIVIVQWHCHSMTAHMCTWIRCMQSWSSPASSSGHCLTMTVRVDMHTRTSKASDVTCADYTDTITLCRNSSKLLEAGVTSALDVRICTATHKGYAEPKDPECDEHRRLVGHEGRGPPCRRCTPAPSASAEREASCSTHAAAHAAQNRGMQCDASYALHSTLHRCLPRLSCL